MDNSMIKLKLIALSFLIVSTIFSHKLQISTGDFQNSRRYQLSYRGDQWLQYLQDENKYTIIKNPDDGKLYYAQKNGSSLEPSPYRVGSVNPQSVGIEPNLAIDHSVYQFHKEEYLKERKNKVRAPHTGTINAVCLFIRFSDQSEFTQPLSTYERKFNGNGTSSVQDYYKEVSYDKLTIKGHFFPRKSRSYQDIHPRNYYLEKSANNPTGWSDVREARKRDHELYKRALEYIIDDIPDDLDIDADKDGFVDYMCIILRGKSGTWGDVGLWPHSGVFDSYTVKAQGARFYNFSAQTDGDGAGGNVSAGTLCHEIFHVLGAPDLYVYKSAPITPVGVWDIMARGHRHMGAHFKYKFSEKNWIKEIPLITKAGKYTLNPLIKSDNNCYRINSPFSKNEYFVLEYRKKEGLYEGGLPSSGLCISRINDAADGNGFGEPYEVFYLREGTDPKNGSFSADNGQTKCVTTLGDGSPGGVIIKNISSAGTTISFDVEIVSCKITAPIEGEILTKGNTVKIVAEANDNKRDITSVEFFINGKKISQSSSAPYEYEWDTQNEKNGTYLLSVKAINNNQLVSNDEITVYLTDGAPITTITSPERGASLNNQSPIKITAEVKKLSTAIKNVKFYLGTKLLHTDNNPPYEFDWTVSSPSPRTNYTVRAVAKDNNDKTGEDTVTFNLVEDLLFEDFEGESWPPKNWTINSKDYGWYNATKLPYSGKKSCATRNYHVQGAAIIKSPVVKLPSNSTLEFYWVDRSLDVTKRVENHDTTFCEISVDNGQTWELLDFLSAKNLEAEYHKASFDLRKYTGKDAIFRWRDVSDETLDAHGTSIDFIRVFTSAAVPIGQSNKLIQNFVQVTQSQKQLFLIFNNKKISRSSIVLRNLQGRVVQNIQFNRITSNYTLDLSGLSRGIYLLSIKNGPQYFSQKIVHSN